MDDHSLLLTFVVLFAVFVILQAVVLIGMMIATRKAIAGISETTNDLRATVIPAVQSTRALLERISPQVVTVAQGVARLTDTVCQETDSIKTSAAEIMERVKKQTERLDEMLTHGLDVVDRAGHLVESAVAAPVRQANGIFAAMKAVVDTYRSPSPRRNSKQETDSTKTAGTPYATAASAKTRDDFEI